MLTDAIVDEFLAREEVARDTWNSYGKYERVADRLERLGQIAHALPYVSRAITRKFRESSLRRQHLARVDAIAARVHSPTGAYATLVHKRSFAEAFA